MSDDIYVDSSGNEYRRIGGGGGDSGGCGFLLALIFIFLAVGVGAYFLNEEGIITNDQAGSLVSWTGKGCIFVVLGVIAIGIIYALLQTLWELKWVLIVAIVIASIILMIAALCA